MDPKEKYGLRYPPYDLSFAVRRGCRRSVGTSRSGMGGWGNQVLGVRARNRFGSRSIGVRYNTCRSFFEAAGNTLEATDSLT